VEIRRLRTRPEVNNDGHEDGLSAECDYLVSWLIALFLPRLMRMRRPGGVLPVRS
jgi:hypothetical protein